MRELKFRVWDIEHERWASTSTLEKWVHFNYKDQGFTLSPGSKQETWHVAPWGESFIIEQSTGLHDKNGKEIYEGDITKTDTGTISVVVFKENAQFVCYNQAGNFDLLYDGSFEIIGNIHENLELLKGGNNETNSNTD